MSESFDIVIVGGGLVGASLACALADSGLHIAVVDAASMDADGPGRDSAPRFDERSIALAYGASRIFKGIGVWSLMQEAGLTPIHSIHVSDRQHAGLTRLHREDEAVDALGYIVPMRVMGAALVQRMSQLENVTQYCPASVASIHIMGDGAQVEIESAGKKQTLETKLVIGADGIHSVVRDAMGVALNAVDYHQHAVIANIATEFAHVNVAYERFTETGPMAVLPLADDASGLHRSALVWTVNEKDSNELMSLDEDIFLARLQGRFGNRLGKIIKVGTRSCFPLGLQYAKEQIAERVALIGNAAHTLHPVAGQGFNLGLRDVAVMAQVLTDAQRAGEDIGSLQVLQRYAEWRRRDHRRVVGFTDGLVRLFSNNAPPLVMARNLGLVLADVFPPIKRLITRQAMGLSGKLPRLSRGLKL
jgi:2-octaprenyl-6-methoxyphenol hydroxylase